MKYTRHTKIESKYFLPQSFIIKVGNVVVCVIQLWCGINFNQNILVLHESSRSHAFSYDLKNALYNLVWLNSVGKTAADESDILLFLCLLAAVICYSCEWSTFFCRYTVENPTPQKQHPTLIPSESVAKSNGPVLKGLHQLKIFVDRQSVRGILGSSRYIFDAILFHKKMLMFFYHFSRFSWEIYTSIQLFSFTSLELSHAFSYNLINILFNLVWLNAVWKTTPDYPEVRPCWCLVAVICNIL